MLGGAILFTASCTSDDTIVQPDLNGDVLAMMNPGTRVGIATDIAAEAGQGVESRASESEAPVYALGEIHASGKADFMLHLPGASNPNAVVLRTDGNDNTTENASTAVGFGQLNSVFPLHLKDFNLVSNNRQVVTRWTQLEAYSAHDYLMGAARLAADEKGNPVLEYALQHARTKLTVKLTSDGTTPIPLDEDITVSLTHQSARAELFAQAPDGGLQRLMDVAANNITGHTDDYDGTPRLLTYQDDAQMTETALTAPVDADGTVVEGGNMVNAIVSPTPTHILSDGGGVAALPDAGLDGDELVIVVRDDYQGLTPEQSGGTYRLKLKDVTVVEGEKLTALNPGEHITLTVTLKHNRIVTGTASVGEWMEATADWEENKESARLPNYEYDAATNTYTVYQTEGIEAWAEAYAEDNTAKLVLVLPNSAETSFNLAPFLFADPDYRISIDAEGDLIWRGLKWKGINLRDADGRLHPLKVFDNSIDGYSLCLQIGAAYLGILDGVSTDVGALKNQINTYLANEIDGFYVLGELTSFEGTAKTTVGEALRTSNATAGTLFLLMDYATTIPEAAFAECTALKEVSAENVTSLGKRIFSGCTGLTSLSFASKLVTLDTEAFGGFTAGDACDLTLHADQLSMATPITAAGSKPVWQGLAWKSATLKDAEGNTTTPTANGNVLSMEVDYEQYAILYGNDATDRVKNLVEEAAAQSLTRFYVIGSLIAGTGTARTLLGEGIRTSDLSDGTTLFLVLPDELSFGEYAFADCTSLEGIEAKSVTSVGEYAFSGCTALSEWETGEITSIGIAAFRGCSSLFSMSLPAVQTISESAFQGCSNIHSFQFENATSIGKSAFQDCTSLQHVELQNVTVIGEFAFAGCTDLTSVTLGSKITSLGTGVFDGTDTDGDDYTLACSLSLHTDQLNHESLPVSASEGRLMWAGKEWKSIVLSESIPLFAMGNEVKEIEILEDEFEKIAKIDGGMKDMVTDMVTDTVATIQACLDAITNIGISQLYVTGQLATRIPDEGEAATILGEAIRRGYNTFELNLTDATSVPDFAFYDCSLYIVKLDKATSIGKSAFAGVSNVVTIEAPKVTTISDNAFHGCSGLTSLIFGSVITSVGTDAFAELSNYCRLTLHPDQLYHKSLPVSASEGRLMWAGKEWPGIYLTDESWLEAEGDTYRIVTY